MIDPYIYIIFYIIRKPLFFFVSPMEDALLRGRHVRPGALGDVGGAAGPLAKSAPRWCQGKTCAMVILIGDLLGFMKGCEWFKNFWDTGDRRVSWDIWSPWSLQLWMYWDVNGEKKSVWWGKSSEKPWQKKYGLRISGIVWMEIDQFHGIFMRY